MSRQPKSRSFFFMMYPIMKKIDFSEIVKAGRHLKPALLPLAGTHSIDSVQGKLLEILLA